MPSHVPTAREIMTRRLVTLRPDMRAFDAAGLLLKHKISGAPVTDGDGKLLGLLSEFDCLRAVATAEYDLDNRDSIVTVSDLMTPVSHSVSPDLDLFGIAQKFVTLRVRRLPVLEDGRLVGQVSRRDALRAAYEVRSRTLNQKRYPDYPEGRAPIRDYPKKR
jgi:CBS domain-containing protein